MAHPEIDRFYQDEIVLTDYRTSGGLDGDHPGWSEEAITRARRNFKPDNYTYSPIVSVK